MVLLFLVMLINVTILGNAVHKYITVDGSSIPQFMLVILIMVMVVKWVTAPAV